MENTTRISCSAVTHIGTGRAVNEDRIYANGKFLNTFGYDNSNISLEVSGSQFIFALSDGMDTGSDAGSSISINEELKKFHQKARNSMKDIQVKLDDMADYVQQSCNLLYSMSLGEEVEKEWNGSFAGIIIDNGSLAVVNLGNCKIFKLEDDNLRLLLNDNRKTERLLKMGIISDEQAELISSQYKDSGSDNSLKVKKSEIFKLKEGNVYLLCSDGLFEAVNEDSIYGILAENKDTDAAASLLVNEALENGSGDNITAMVIKVEKAGGDASIKVTPGSIPSRRIHSTPARYSRASQNKSLDTAKLVKTCITFAIIAAIVFGGFTLWKLFRNPDENKAVLSEDSTQSSTSAMSSTGSTVPGNSSDNEGTQSSTAFTTTNADTNGVTVGEAGIVIDENTTYKVKAGDSLTKISKMFYGDDKEYQVIMDANDIKDPKRIQIGRVLKIPPLN